MTDKRTTEEYCAQHECEKRDRCVHYEIALKIAPEQAFMMKSIESNECSSRNGWVRYFSSDIKNK